MAVSPNFTFLGVHDAQLVKIGTLAERYFQDDPVTCLIKLRQFGELLAQLVAANVGLYTNPDESQLDLLNRLQSQNLIPGDVKNLFHQIRKSGNDAVHNLLGSHGLALSHLRYARELGIWFHRTFGRNSRFKPGAFIPPADPAQETKELRVELARLRKQAEASRSKAELAAAKALEETELRKLAEDLLEEAEALLEQRLNTIQSITVSKSSKLIQKTVTAANDAEKQIDLDENETDWIYINTTKYNGGLETKKQKENLLRNGLSIGIGLTGLLFIVASGAGLLIGMPMLAGVIYYNLVHHKVIEPIDFKEAGKQVAKQVIKLGKKTVQVGKKLTKQVIKLAKKVIKVSKEQVITLCTNIIKYLEN